MLNKILSFGFVSLMAVFSMHSNATVISQTINLDSIDYISGNSSLGVTTGQIGSLSYDLEACQQDLVCTSFGVVSDVSLNLNVAGLSFDESFSVDGAGAPSGFLVDSFDPSLGVFGLFASLFDGLNSVSIFDTTFLFLDPFSEFVSGTISFGEVNASTAAEVSEPTTFALLLSGLFALFMSRRRV